MSSEIPAETPAAAEVPPPTPVAATATAASAAAPAASSADPAPLGLAGFAVTTLMLSFINTHIIKEDGAIIVVLGLAAFYGGIAQFAAGLFEFRRGNTFGATAFASYGAFWLSYWWIVTHLNAASGDVHQALGLFLLLWAVFTAYMAVASLRVSSAVLAVFVLLTLTFVFLAIGSFQNGMPAPDAMTKVGGWLGIATGVAALYASAATVVNATHRRSLLPTGPR
ncbi:acetate uptake transporter [Streptacidiphilus cavernicola]|uniref:Acetate uptake transporter n=1 Tax=Streptacidiphilus cavernicola TaxID=3342716 RepID=A0ABV6VPE7_9ACTN